MCENKKKNDDIIEFGQMELSDIYILTIIGEIEGHEELPSTSKTTKYEHILPKLAEIEDSSRYKGVLVLINTVGGDVESGLAIAEMLSTLSKPTVSLVLGGSHSIGIPLCVAADYSLIVPSGTMIVHPVRMDGMMISAPQTYEYFKIIQDRILDFIVTHSDAKKEKVIEMMFNTGTFTKDLGTILVGKEAVECGIADEVGGISLAICRLRELIANKE